MVKERIATFSGVSPDQLERIALSQYNPGDQYYFHTDKSLDSTEVFLRYRTAIVFLNDDFLGGETLFPRMGVSVKPKTGKAVMFKYDTPEEFFYTVHAGGPVLSGSKKILNVFIQKVNLELKKKENEAEL